MSLQEQIDHAVGKHTQNIEVESNKPPAQQNLKKLRQWTEQRKRLLRDKPKHS